MDTYVFLFYTARESKNKLSAEVQINSIETKRVTKIALLGSDEKLIWKK
jgi:alpha-L-fucosidase